MAAVSGETTVADSWENVTTAPRESSGDPPIVNWAITSFANVFIKTKLLVPTDPLPSINTATSAMALQDAGAGAIGGTYSDGLAVGSFVGRDVGIGVGRDVGLVVG